jgi:hypothetical protein
LGNRPPPKNLHLLQILFFLSSFTLVQKFVTLHQTPFIKNLSIWMNSLLALFEPQLEYFWKSQKINYFDLPKASSKTLSQNFVAPLTFELPLCSKFSQALVWISFKTGNPHSFSLWFSSPSQAQANPTSPLPWPNLWSKENVQEKSVQT